MLGAWSFNNNVRCVLTSGIGAFDTTMTLNQAVAPMKDPPVITTADPPAIFTLVDNLAAPTKIEIVHVTTIASPSGGTIAISGMSRGKDGTTEQAWSGGAIVIQSLTKEMLEPFDWMTFDYEVEPSTTFGGMAALWDRRVVTNLGPSLSQAIFFGLDKSASGALYGSFTAIEVDGLNVSVTFAATGLASFSGAVTVTSAGTLGVAGTATLSGSTIISKAAPVNSSAPGVAKEIRFDSNYIYIAVGTNNWKRVALSAF